MIQNFSWTIHCRGNGHRLRVTGKTLDFWLSEKRPQSAAASPLCHPAQLCLSPVHRHPDREASARLPKCFSDLGVKTLWEKRVSGDASSVAYRKTSTLTSISWVSQSECDTGQMLICCLKGRLWVPGRLGTPSGWMTDFNTWWPAPNWLCELATELPCFASIWAVKIKQEGVSEVLGKYFQDRTFVFRGFNSA